MTENITYLHMRKVMITLRKRKNRILDQDWQTSKLLNLSTFTHTCIDDKTFVLLESKLIAD